MAGTKLAVNYAIDHPTGEALRQIAPLQSAIFDIGEMTTAIKAWQAKSDAEFAPLAAVPRL